MSVARRYLAADDDLTFPLDVASGFAASAGATLELLPGDHCLMLSAPSVVVGRSLEVRRGRSVNRPFGLLAAHGPSTFTNIAADELVGSGLIGAWLRGTAPKGAFMSKPDGSGGHEKPSLWTPGEVSIRRDPVSRDCRAAVPLSVRSALITLLLTRSSGSLKESPLARGNFVTLLSSSGRGSSDSLKCLRR